MSVGNTENEIKEVKDKIKAVEEKIEVVEEEIKAVVVKIEVETDADERKALRDDKNQLRDDKKQLRKKEEQLNERLNNLLLQQQQQQQQPNDNQLVTILNRIEQKVDDMDTVSMGMSDATQNFTRSLLCDGGLSFSVNPAITESVEPALDKYQWGEKEDEAEGQPGCQIILESELLPLELNGINLGIFDVRNKWLPEVQVGKRKSNGFSDLALGDQTSMSLPQNKDLIFSYTVALVELKTGKADLKQGQLLLQLVSLSQISNNRKGVVVLGTDCAEKWRLAFFSKYNEIIVQPFTCGRKCLQELKRLLNMSAANGKTLVPPAPMQSIPEDSGMDLTGNETEDFQNYIRGAKLRKLAFDLGKLYPDERESLDMGWTRDVSDVSPPSMIYM